MLFLSISFLLSLHFSFSPFGYGCRTTASSCSKVNIFCQLPHIFLPSFHGSLASWEYFFRKYAFQLIAYLFLEVAHACDALPSYFCHWPFSTCNLFWSAWGPVLLPSRLFFSWFSASFTLLCISSRQRILQAILEDCLCYSSLLCTNEHYRPLCRTCVQAVEKMGEDD